MTRYYFYDTEVFPNYFLVEIYSQETDSFQEFEYFGDPDATHDRTALIAAFQADAIFVGFNSQSYDDLVLKEFFARGTIRSAKTLSDKIIVGEIKSTAKISTQNIDVLGVMDRKGSLKIYECRLGLSQIVESSHDFTKPLEEKDLSEIKKYCQHDVKSTCALFNTKLAQEKLAVKQAASKEFGLDLESLTEAQIASRIVEREIIEKTKLPKHLLKSPCFVFSGSDVINPSIGFQTVPFQSALDAAKSHNFVYSDKQKRLFSYDISCQNLTLHVANGGLHSVGKTAIITNLQDDESILDFDVASFYPSAILIESIAPPRAKTTFLEFYKGIVESRLSAKRNGEKTKSDTYKIILNATYGKFGDQYSLLYNPKNLLAVTLNCQFRILQLIEKITLIADLEILQANTDGITIFCKTKTARALAESTSTDWQKETGYSLEKTEYSKLVMADVNNYFALKPDGKRKEKGSFQTERSLFGGGKEALIIPKAIQAYFIEGIEPENFIQQPTAQTLEAFVMFRKRDKTDGENLAGCNSKVNRFVFSKSSKNELKGCYADDKKIKVAANIQLANDYACVILDDIDIDRYIADAKKRIAEIKGEKPTKPPKPPKEKKAVKSKSKDEAVTAPPKATKPRAKKTVKVVETPLFDGFDEAEETPQNKLDLLLASSGTPDETKAANELLFDSGSYHVAHAGKKDSLKKLENRTYFTYPVVDLKRLSWVQLNPSENGCESHASQYVLCRQSITLEYDNLPLVEQYEKFSEIPHTVICYSGGKSIHCHIRFVRPLAEAEEQKLVAYLKAIFPTADNSVLSRSQFVRVPGGYNYDTQKEQRILSVQSRVEPELFLAWLEKEREKEGIEIDLGESASEESAQNPVKFAYLEWLFDRELKGYRKQKGQWPNGQLEGYYYTSNCPHATRHTDGKTAANEFSIFLSVDGEIRKKCQHSHCSDIWKESLVSLVGVNPFDRLNFRLFANTQEYNDLGLNFDEFCQAIKGENLKKEPLKLEETEKQQATGESEIELSAAFNEPGYVWIIAPPASGKSRESGRAEKLAIEAKTPFCYVANNLKDLGEYREKTQLEDLVFELKGGKKTTDESEGNTEDLERTPHKLSKYTYIDTHKTYISRKGDGPIFYPLLNWLIEKQNEGTPATVVIDEINEFVSSLDRFVPIETTMIGLRYNGESEKYYTRYLKCPAFEKKSYRCHLCESCKNIAFENDKVGGNYLIRLKSGKESEIKNVPIDLPIERTVYVPELNFDIHYLKQDPDYLKRRDEYYKVAFEDDEYFELSHLNDLIQSALVPAILEFYPTLNGVRWQHSDDATEEEKARVVFPSRACGRWLNVLDLTGLDAIKKACKNVRFLSTHESPETKAVLQAVFPNLKIRHVKKATEKQEKIICIGFGKTLNPKEFSKLSGTGKKYLYFDQTNRDAKRFFDSLDEKALAGLDLLDAMVPKEKSVFQEKNIVVANSFGRLGKAVRLTEYGIVFVNPCNEPRFKKYKFQTKDAIISAIQEYQKELMIQNSCRLLGDQIGTKYFVFPKISEVGFESLLEQLKLSDIAETFDIRYIEHDESLLYKILLGTAKVEDSEAVPEKKGRRQMDVGKKQRVLCKEDIEKDKAAKKDEKLLAKIEACKKEIAENKNSYQSWKEFRDKNHVTRFDPKTREILKILFLGLE